MGLETQVTDSTDEIQKWSQDTQETVEALKSLLETPLKDDASFVAFLADYDAFKLVLVAAEGKAQDLEATAVTAAIDRMQLPRVNVLQDVLQKTYFGQEVMAKVKFLLQETANDDLGTGRLKIAVTSVNDDRVPVQVVKDASLVNEGGEEPAVVKKICLIENTSLLEELEFVEVLEESLLSIQESIQLITPMKIQSAMSWLEQWMNLIGEKALLCDKWLTMKLASTIGCSELDAMVESLKLDVGDAVAPDEQVCRDEEAMIAALKRNMEQVSAIDETLFAEWVANLDKFLCSTPWKGFQRPQSLENIKSILDKNSTLRSNAVSYVKDFVSVAAHCCGSATPADQCIEDWLEHRAKGTLGGSILEKAVVFQRSRATLLEKWPSLVAPTDEAHKASDGNYCFCSGSQQTLTELKIVNFDTSTRYILELAKLPLAKRSDEMLNAVPQHILDELFKAFHTGCLVPNPNPKDASGLKLVDAVVDRQKANELYKEAVKIFNAPDPSKERFSASELCDLLEKLLLGGSEHIPEHRTVSCMRRGIFKAIEDDDKTLLLPASAVLNACRVYKMLTVCLGALTFLSNIFLKKPATVSNHDLCLDKRLHCVFSTLKHASGYIVDNIDEVIGALALVPMTLALSSVKAVALVLRDHIVPNLADYVLEHGLAELQNHAQKVDKTCPPYAHYLNDAKYNHSSVTRYVLNNPARSSWQGETMKMWVASNSLASWSKTFLGLELSELEKHKDHYSEIDGALHKLKSLCAVVSGASALQELSVNEGITKAEDLCSKASFKVPQAMRMELERLCASAASAPPEAKRRKK